MGSPINWDAAFDILLCALSTVKVDRFYTKGSSDVLTPALDIAYADDLLSGMSSLAGIQEKANIVSAFAIIFGLDIATSKLRTFQHLVGISSPRTPLIVDIHTSGWVPVSIPVATTGTLKALGMLYDISSPNLHQSQFLATKLRAERSCNIVSLSRGSRHQLRKVVSSCIAKRVEYTGKLSSWTPKQQDEIDNCFAKTYKKLTHNSYYYPNDLVFLPTQLGGLGFTRPSDEINSSKFAIMQRHLREPGAIAQAVDTLIYNGASHSSQLPRPGMGITIFPPEKLDTSCWVNSLAHSNASADLFLSRQGSASASSPDTTIIASSRPSDPPALWKFVHDRRISTIGDLYSYVPGSPAQWHDFSESGGKELAELQVGNPPLEPVHLHSNQYWLPSPDANLPWDTIVEIVGITHDDPPLLNIRTLKTNNEGRVGLLQGMRPSRDPLMGGSSKISLPPVNVLGHFPRRVYLNPPLDGSDLLSVGFISQPSSYSLCSPTPEFQWLTPDFKRRLIELGPFSVFSDGSWAKAGSPWDHITSNAPTFSGSVGLAFISTLSDWKDRDILTVQLTNGQALESLSAFSMELLGILVGLSIASQLPESDINIFSDCKSAVQQLQSLRTGTSHVRSKSRDASLLNAAVDHWKTLEDLTIEWIPGHPEVDQPDASLWTREMWGILLIALLQGFLTLPRNTVTRIFGIIDLCSLPSLLWMLSPLLLH